MDPEQGELVLGQLLGGHRQEREAANDPEGALHGQCDASALNADQNILQVNADKTSDASPEGSSARGCGGRDDNDIIGIYSGQRKSARKSSLGRVQGRAGDRRGRGQRTSKGGASSALFLLLQRAQLGHFLFLSPFAAAAGRTC